MAKAKSRGQRKQDQYHATVKLWVKRFSAVADYYHGRRPGVFIAACEKAGLGKLPSGSPLTERDFEKIRALIHKRAGISLGSHKREMVYSRLARRLLCLRRASPVPGSAVADGRCPCGARHDAGRRGRATGSQRNAGNPQ